MLSPAVEWFCRRSKDVVTMRRGYSKSETVLSLNVFRSASGERVLAKR